MTATPFFLDDSLLEKSSVERVKAVNTAFFRERANAWVDVAAAPVIREAEKFGFKFDPIAALKNPHFNLAEAAKQLREGKYRLSETVTTSMVYALANVATTASAATAYKLIPVVYRSLCEVVPSKKAEETYFALQRGDIPGPVGETGAAPESRVGGVLVRIKNYDFARIWRTSRNLEDDDQTGQIAKLGQTIGEGMAYTEELWALTTFFYAYVAANVRPAYGSGGAGIIPSRCIAGQNPADGGPTTTAGDLTLANAEALLQAADYVTDIQGNYALTSPDSILVAGSRRVAAKKIFGSPVNPAGASTTAGQGPTGTGIAGAFAINPLHGELVIFHTPMVNKAVSGGLGLDATNPPWAIGMAGKGWMFQDREPLEVMQEAENAGDSFRSRSRGTRAWRRFGCGVGYGEAWLRGN